MKLNNKGFAISTIMYMILIMAIVLITLTLSILSARKLILDKIRKETNNNIYNVYAITYRQALETLKEEAITYGEDNNVSKKSIKISDINSSIDQEILDGYNLSEKYLTIVENNDTYDVYLGKATTVTDISTNLDTFIDIADYKIYGNSTQQTYTGKNLFNINAAISYWGTENYMLVDGNNIIVKGLGKAYAKPFVFTDDSSQTFTIRGAITNGSSTNPRVGVCKVAEDGTITDRRAYISLTSQGATFTGYNAIYFDWSTAGSSDIKYTISNLQIEKGNQATEYEPYVGGIPSPNPNYPQEIRSVGAESGIPITASGKNLAQEINSQNYNTTHFNSRTSAQFMVENDFNYVRIYGNESNSNIDTAWRLRSNKAQYLEAGDYVLSFYARSENSLTDQSITYVATNKGSTGIYNDNSLIVGADKVYYFANDGKWHKIEIKLTLSSDVVNGKINIGNDVPDIYGEGSYIDIANIQLEKGSVATPYTPYYRSSFNIDLNEPLRKIGDYADYIDLKNGKVVRNIGMYILNGSERWKKRDEYNQYVLDASVYSSLSNLKINYVRPNMLSNRYKNTIYATSSEVKDLTFHNLGITEGIAIKFMNNNITTLEQWKDELSNNPIIVNYTLTNPIEQSIEVPNISDIGEYTKISIGTDIDPSSVEFTVINKIRQL